MVIDFKGLLDAMEEDEISTIANDARPGENRLFNAILPEQLKRGYSAKGGAMKIRSTMAKLVAMDSPYPRAGVSERSSWNYEIAKMAVDMPFPEEYLRELRELVNDRFNNTIDDEEQVLETMFNFVDKLLVEPLLETGEWLRSQALLTGRIQWQSDDIELDVDYGIPAANFLTARTGSDGYGGSTSKFWVDWYSIQRILKNRVRAVFMNTMTLHTILYNPVNNIKVVKQDDVAGIFEFQRYVNNNGVLTVSEDIRDRISIIIYDDEAEVLDNDFPGQGITKLVPFCPNGAMLAIGAFDSRTFQIGTGNTQPTNPFGLQLGITHVGPTEEGNGKLGRWARTYVPEEKPWMFVGQSVTNLLPIIWAPERIVNATTEVVTS